MGGTQQHDALTFSSRISCFLYSLYLASSLTILEAQAIDYRYACLDKTNSGVSSTFQENLNNVVSLLTSDAATTNGFSKRTVGKDQDMAYGLYFCRADVNSSLCHSCVQDSGKVIRNLCPNNASAAVWYPYCLLRYSDKNFFGILSTSPWIPMLGASNKSSPYEFDGDARMLMNGLIQTASEEPLMFGTHMFNINGTQKRYGWVQCSRDISRDACRTCLSALVSHVSACCTGKQVWRIFCQSCIMMYETQPFYSVKGSEPNPIFSSPDSKGGIGRSRILMIAIVSGVVSLCVFCICYLRCRNCRERDLVQLDPSKPMSKAEFDTTSVPMGYSENDLPTMPLSVILHATDYFSSDSKLGEGGFGPVYKGILSHGTEAAVKRLSETSGQGVEEFRNEVIFIAKLQHRNLVRLLGWCAEQNEKLLVYEYMPNSSLDFHLFDYERSKQLDWNLRLSIINGIARGLLYLHEDSRLRVIHRDLKASNILLDSEMNPKISDFGLARTFGVDDRHGTTGRVVGTYGYMAPEYAMQGLFSVKSDVFSFGVLMLEIISGKKNSSFHLSQPDHQSLLNYAWRLWCIDKSLELIDPLLSETSGVSSELSKCIHIGLLCVQEDAADRPSMSSVVVMLATDTMILPNPQHPAFSVGRKKEERKSGEISHNDVTISDIVPR